MTPSDILGVVLAGGRSRRLGRDKAALRWDGSTLAERAARLLEPLFGEVVVAGPPAVAPPGIEAVADVFPGHGPLAGLHAGLVRGRGRAVFALACDLPFVERRLVDHLLAAASSGGEPVREGAWVAAAERPQPLCGLYAAAGRAEAERRLGDGQRSVLAFFEAIGGVAVPIGPHLDFYRPELLLNLNRPADLRDARRLRRAAGAGR